METPILNFITMIKVVCICVWITGSHNGWSWKGHLDVIWSNLPAQAGPPKPNFWDFFFNIPKDWDFTTSLGNLLSVLHHLHTKNVFPDVQKAPPVFQPVPIASDPVIRHHWKAPGSVLFVPSLQVLININKIPSWAFSSLGWMVLGLSLLSHVRCPSPLIMLVSLCWTLSNMPVYLCLFCTEELKTECNTPGVVLPALKKGEGWPLLTCWQCIV